MYIKTFAVLCLVMVVSCRFAACDAKSDRVITFAPAGYRGEQPLPALAFPPLALGECASLACWPSSLDTVDYNGIVDPGCSAVLIGPRVLLTARHCFTGSDKTPKCSKETADYATDMKTKKVAVYLPYETGYTRYIGENCAISEDLDIASNGLDMALCLMNEPEGDALEALKVMVFETVNTDAKILEKDTSLTLVASGNTNDWDGCLDSMLATLLIRKVRVRIIEMGDPWFSVQGYGSICPGDSGGGVYLVWGPEDTDCGPMYKRTLVGVIKSGGCEPKSTDCIHSVTSDAAKAFFTTWREKHPEGLICGFDDEKIKAQGLGSCR